MPSFICTMKSECPDEELANAKELAKSQGATITHEYTLFPAFAFSVPEGTVMTLDSHEHVDKVEPDQVMTTQS